MTDHPSITARDLAWAGCLNARELGGLPTSDGDVTCSGELVRTDMLSRLEPEGLDALRAYGVRTVIDLRNPGELATRPSPLAAGVEGVRYLHLPLEGDDPEVRARMRASQTREEVYALILDHYAPQVGAVLRAIVAHDDGPLAFHCHAGKDRTGIVAAILLELAGVPDDIIAADYAYTETTGYAGYDVLVAENGGQALTADDLAAPAEAMQATLDHLRATYGSVAAYLARAGLSSAEIASLRARLRRA
jgi:protein-tyrosine phosphatase